MYRTCGATLEKAIHGRLACSPVRPSLDSTPSPTQPAMARVALMTGAGQGIGRAVATELAAEGTAVALNDLNSRAVEQAAVELGPDALALAGDVTDAGLVRGL